MTNEEKDLLIAYLVDTGDIDPDGDVEAQFLEWYQVRDQVVSGEAHYKAVLEAAGYGSGATPVATGPAVASVGMNGPRPLGPTPWAPPDMLALRQDQPVCDHGTPCGCYVESYAAGRSRGLAMSGKR